MGACLTAEFLAEASDYFLERFGSLPIVWPQPPASPRSLEGLRRQRPPAEGEEGQQGLEAGLLPVGVLFAHQQRGEQGLLRTQAQRGQGAQTNGGGARKEEGERIVGDAARRASVRGAGLRGSLTKASE